MVVIPRYHFSKLAKKGTTLKKIHNSHYRQIASVKESLLATFTEENCIIVTKQLLRDCIAGKAEVRQKAWPTLLRLLRLLGVESVNPDMQAINEAAVWRATPPSVVKRLMAGEPLAMAQQTTQQQQQQQR